MRYVTLARTLAHVQAQLKKLHLPFRTKKQALSHLSQLLTSLGGLVHVTSAATWQNCSNVHRLLRSDAKPQTLNAKP